MWPHADARVGQSGHTPTPVSGSLATRPRPCRAAWPLNDPKTVIASCKGPSCKSLNSPIPCSINIAEGLCRWTWPSVLGCWPMSLGSGHCALGYVAGQWPMPPCVGLCRWAYATVRWAMSLGSGLCHHALGYVAGRWPLCVGLCRWAVAYATMRRAVSLGVCLPSLGMGLALGMSLCVYLSRHNAKSL